MGFVWSAFNTHQKQKIVEFYRHMTNWKAIRRQVFIWFLSYIDNVKKYLRWFCPNVRKIRLAWVLIVATWD